MKRSVQPVRSTAVALMALCGLLIQAVPATAAPACAPTEATSGTDKILTFTNLTACQWTVPTGVRSLRILLVAGGGGGGATSYQAVGTTTHNGGGGGGGEVRDISSQAVVSGETVTITVGAGGTGGNGGVTVTTGDGPDGTNGGDSTLTFSTTTSADVTAVGGGGGGGGGWYNGTPAYERGRDGLAGGSGGGGGSGTFIGGSGGASTASAGGLGFAGSDGRDGTGSIVGAGHGGGAGGAADSNNPGGAYTSDITAVSISVARGGYGTTDSTALWYQVNRDWPGSGAESASSTNLYPGFDGSGNGENGIVIIRYSTLPPAPTITSVSWGSGALAGATGPTGGGGTLSLTGDSLDLATGFTVAGSACPTVGTSTSTTATCTLPAYAGSTTDGGAVVDVVATHASSPGTLANGFTYLDVPLLSSVSPTAGPFTSPGTLTLAGTGFATPMTVAVGGNSCTSVSVSSATSATCTLPDGSAGSVDVSATTTGGTTGAQSFRYVAAPSITSVTPSTVSIDGGTTVTIAGTGFVAGASPVSVSVAGSACTSVSVASETSLTCVTPAKSAGSQNVTVTAAGGTSSTSPVTYAAIPSVTSVTPGSLSTTGGSITIAGSRFSETPANNAVALGAGTCTPTASTTTSITCSVPGGQSPGQVDVSVTVGSATGTLADGLRFVTPPTVTQVLPSAGPAAGRPVTVTGTGFIADQTAVDVGGNACTEVSVVSGTSLTCTVPPGTAGAPVTVGVTVYSVDGIGTGTFQYVDLPGAPTSVVAVAGVQSAQVTWTAPSSGGDVDTYSVASTPTGGACTVNGPTTSCTITGLTAGTSYTFIVTAGNGAGTMASSPSNAVVPTAPSGGGAGGSTPTPTSTQSAAPTASASSLDPILHSDNAAIPAAGLPAGGALLLSDGNPVPATVVPTPRRSSTALLVREPGLTPPFNMRLEGRGDESDPLGLTSKQALILQSETVQAQTASVSLRAQAKSVRVQPVAQSAGDGFMANSPVKFYILPNVYLGDLTTDAAGAYKGSVPIPAGIRPGVYTLQANGYAPDGSVRSLSIGLVVKPTQAPARTAKDRTTVYFKSLSAQLTPAGKKSLRRLAARTGRNATTVVSIGYVQPVGGTANDKSLSKQRARSVAAYLRDLGVKGRYVVKGAGRAQESGATARRVEVTITYRR